MRVLRKEAGEKTNFPAWMIIVLMVAVIGGFLYSTEPKEEETIEQFIEKVEKADENTRLKFKLSNVTPKQTRDIKDVANIDVSGFSWVIDNYLVGHAKKHKEIKMDDYKRLYRTINSYDSLKYAVKQKQGIIKLEMYKTYDRLNILIIEIRRSEIYIATMYKRKQKQTSAHK